MGPRETARGLRVGGDRWLDLSRPLVMGILNVTPDSFSDGGRFHARDAALEQGLRMAAGGADLIDVGGESTRPGAAEVPLQQELDRVVPVIEYLADRTDATLSVDTSKPAVMREAVAAGAGLINDVRALRQPGALDTARELQVAVCLMHMQGTPRTMQADPVYDDVVGEVRAFLAERLQACEEAGVARECLIIDPGFGFGKTLEHNLALLRGMRALTDLGAPLLAGLSRKSSVARLTGSDGDDRVFGSIALALAAVREGASLLRVHDVRATLDAVRVWQAVYD